MWCNMFKKAALWRLQAGSAHTRSVVVMLSTDWSGAGVVMGIYGQICNTLFSP